MTNKMRKEINKILTFYEWGWISKRERDKMILETIDYKTTL